MTKGLLNSRISKINLSKLCAISPTPENSGKYYVVIFRTKLNSGSSKKKHFPKEIFTANLKKQETNLADSVKSNK
jgi:hypothetical protein